MFKIQVNEQSIALPEKNSSIFDCWFKRSKTILQVDLIDFVKIICRNMI